MRLSQGWINLTRECNLRCSWCYARNTGYKDSDTMKLSVAKDIIDIFSDLALSHLTLIGGEPTVYPALFDVLKYANQKNIRTGFVSNGVKYADINFVKELCALGMNRFSISVKGFDANSFKETTGADSFDKVGTGITNCISLGCDVIAFLVLTKENIDTYLDYIYSLFKMGVKRFHIGFLYNFDSSPSYKGYLECFKPNEVISKFKESYKKLFEITKGKVKISPTFPVCAWGEEFINTLSRDFTLSGGCQLRERTGVIFDTDGTLIPCNAMHEIKLGSLYHDFSNASELLSHINTDTVRTIFEKFGSMPSVKCEKCDSASLCRCCACQFTNYSLEQLLDSIY